MFNRMIVDVEIFDESLTDDDRFNHMIESLQNLALQMKMGRDASNHKLCKIIKYTDPASLVLNGYRGVNIFGSLQIKFVSEFNSESTPFDSESTHVQDKIQIGR